MQQPPPRDDGADLDPTVTMPKVEAPPKLEPPPGTVPVSPLTAQLPPHPADRTVASPAPPHAIYEAPPQSHASPAPPPYAQPPARPQVVAPVIPPPTATVVPERPRYVFGNPIGYTFARFVAFVVDIGLVTVIVTLLIYGFSAINPITHLPTDSEAGFDSALVIGAAVSFVYMLIAEALFGTTIGKLAVGLHVYSSRGGMVGLGRAFIRNVLRPIDALVIGWILALLPGHRRLGDLLGGTVVARSPLRAFAPLVGWILILVLAALPFLVNGLDRTLAGVVVFGQFLPPLVWHGWSTIAGLFAGFVPH